MRLSPRCQECAEIRVGRDACAVLERGQFEELSVGRLVKASTANVGRVVFERTVPGTHPRRRGAGALYLAGVRLCA